MSYIDKKVKGQYKFQHTTTRQRHYCESYFAGSKNELAKHVKRCSSIERILYSFDNVKIISFQDNFGRLGDVPFNVYFDFEASTGDIIFQNPKMFVIICCQIYAFHPALNLDKIVIFKSLKPSA